MILDGAVTNGDDDGAKNEDDDDDFGDFDAAPAAAIQAVDDGEGFGDFGGAASNGDDDDNDEDDDDDFGDFDAAPAAAIQSVDDSDDFGDFDAAVSDNAVAVSAPEVDDRKADPLIQHVRSVFPNLFARYRTDESVEENAEERDTSENTFISVKDVLVSMLS